MKNLASISKHRPLKRGLGVYHMSDAEARAAWTGESIEQAQAAIDAEAKVNTVKIRTGVNAVNLLTPKG